MSIVIKDLAKKYGTQTAVNAISFTANPGEIVGFLGPNGAGKSSTMKMITGFLEKDAGQILVCGEAVENGKINSKKQIGYLPEANPLYNEMYVQEYLQFVANVHQLTDVKVKVSRVIDEVGLQKESSKKIGQLSKGYKQRVGLAAAIIHDPQVLILDEPTSGLDPNQIVEIRSVIKQLGKNKTVLLSSHIMQEVQALCDRVIIINNGNIVADKSMTELMSSSEKIQTVTIAFDTLVDIADLKDLRNAAKVEKINDQYLIETNDPTALKKELLQFAINKNINIGSLHQGASSIEDVFRRLTENK